MVEHLANAARQYSHLLTLVKSCMVKKIQGAFLTGERPF